MLSTHIDTDMVVENTSLDDSLSDAGDNQTCVDLVKMVRERDFEGIRAAVR